MLRIKTTVFVKSLGLATIALVTTRLLFAAAAVVAGYNPLDVESWIRWDSVHYSEIARVGYYVEPLTPNPTQNTWMLADGSRQCRQGNVMWFPLLPAIVSVVGLSGIDLRLAGLIVTATTFFAILTIVAKEQLKSSGFWRSLPVVLLAACFPGAIYYQAYFPHSLIVLLLAVAVYFVDRANRLGGLLAGFVTGLCHSSVVYAGLSLCFIPLLPLKWLRREQRFSSLYAGFGVVAAVAGLFLYQSVKFGTYGTFLDAAQCMGVKATPSFHETTERIFGQFSLSELGNALNLRAACFKREEVYLTAREDNRLSWENHRCHSRESFLIVPGETESSKILAYNYRYLAEDQPSASLLLREESESRFIIENDSVQEVSDGKRWLGWDAGGHHAQLVATPQSIQVERFLPSFRRLVWQIHSAQSVFLMILVLVALGQLTKHWILISTFQRLLILIGLTFYLSTLLVGGSVSVYRLESLALWLTVGLLNIGIRSRLLIAILAIFLSFALAILFFTSDCI